MDRKSIKTMLYAAGASVLGAALLATGSYGMRVAKNPPAWVSENTFKDALVMLKQQMQQSEHENQVRQLEMNASAAWWRCVNAIESEQSSQTVNALSNAFGTAKVAYQDVSGKPYPFNCPQRP